MIRRLIKKLLQPCLVYRCGSGVSRIALTFDDGPWPGHTERVLDILKAAGARATFFVVGAQAEKFPGLVRRMVQDGHEIANHSHAHRRTGALAADMERARASIAAASGTTPALIRPPWGRVTVGLLGYALRRRTKIVLWSFDSLDYKLDSPQALKERFARAALRGGDIVLFHEDYAHTVAALPDILAGLARRGIACGTVREAMGRAS
jgi:peptidoglycan/xylan/chitin deacetylase (PgdA/CDA1 family)